MSKALIKLKSKQEALEKREKAMKEKLKKDKKRLQARIQKVESAEKRRERKRDTRKKILIGAWVLAQIESDRKINLDGEKALMKELEKFLTRKIDLEIFGMETK